MKRPPERLSSRQVELRRWRAADADLCLRLVTESLAHLRPWMPWATSEYDRAVAEGFLQRCEDYWQAGTAFQYLILVTGEPAGSCGLEARIDPGGLEIGYWVHPAYTGRGVATGAARALTAAALALPGIDHVEIHHDELNLASERVPVKLGYTHVETRPRTRELAPANSGASKVWRITR
ncbi:MAG: GNAT family N-acetyltransferase [Streptosporangiaceae bacterium]